MRRTLRSVVVVLGACLVVFGLVRLAPGDPTAFLLGTSATPESIAALRHDLGLDQPLAVQLGKFYANLAEGDFGESILYQRPALDVVLEALPRTLVLAGVAFLLSVVVAVPIGVLAAMHRGTWIDRSASVVVVVAQSVPSFWIGILLIEAFAVRLGWLPTSGSGSWKHVVLPASTLALLQLAVLARSVRSGMLEVLELDYIRAARAKGASGSRIAVVHALRNALIPVVTLLALQLGALLAGSVITEAVFAWPGIGSLAFSSVSARDYPVVQTIVILSAVAIVLSNLVADGLYGRLDPRLRGQHG